MQTGKKRILITGGTGLVGSRISELLSNTFEFIKIGRSSGIDITNPQTFNLINTEGAEILIHLAAKTDVDACETERELGEESEAWRVNVYGTKNIIKFCSEKKIKIIYISTDFVFDGTKPEGQYYIEQDVPNPVNFYAKTKYEAEKIVQDSGLDNIILRISHPYRKKFDKKKDFVRKVEEFLQSGKQVQAITDQIFCPTFIDDIAKVIPVLLEKRQTGIFHIVGKEPVSPFEIFNLICDLLNADKGLIKETTREEYFKGKAKRPFNLYLKNDRIEKLGIFTTSINEGLREVFL